MELVPSVVDAFGYYFHDAKKIMKNKKGKIVIDDGRRFLKRTKKQFDVISIDPPPPIEAAGSSLLYSEEFYSLVKEHLTPNGILQQWFPYGEQKILHAVTRSLYNSFQHIRVYKSIEKWGFHFLASQAPLNEPSVNQFVSKMPQNAREDLMEWFRDKNITKLVGTVLNQKVNVNSLLHENEKIKITDDLPLNEYYVIRRLLDNRKGIYKIAR